MGSTWEGVVTLTADEIDRLLDEHFTPVVVDIIMPTRNRSEELTIWFREGSVPLPPDVPFIAFGTTCLEFEGKSPTSTRMVTPEPPNERLRKFVTRLAWLDGVESGAVYRQRISVNCHAHPSHCSWLVHDIVTSIAELFGGDRLVHVLPAQGYNITMPRKEQ